MLLTGDTKVNYWSELVFTRSQVFEELLQRCPGQDDSGPRVKNRKKNIRRKIRLRKKIVRKILNRLKAESGKSKFEKSK